MKAEPAPCCVRGCTRTTTVSCLHWGGAHVGRRFVCVVHATRSPQMQGVLCPACVVVFARDQNNARPAPEPDGNAGWERWT